MSATQDDIIRYKKAIARTLDAGNVTTALDILEKLRALKVTEELLRKTEIGLFVGKLRSNEDEKVSKLSKDIIRQWKNDVKPAANTNRSSGKSTPKKEGDKKERDGQSKGTPSNISIPVNQTPPSNSEPTTPKSTASVGRTAESDGVSLPDKGDSVRNNAIRMFYKALASDSNADADLLTRRAVGVEEAVYAKFTITGSEYKPKIRSLYLNLLAKDNPSLREAIVSGELHASKLVTMSPAEMLSEERRQMDQKLQEENLFKARGAGVTTAETDQFRCGKCHERKCTYYQMQTRSADEPMTTFVTCVNCNNRWKFC